MQLFSHLTHSRQHQTAPPSEAPFELAIDIESPPAILYGPPTDSSGALISGLLTMTIPTHTEAFTEPLTDPDFPLISVRLALKQWVTYKRPYVPTSSTIVGCHNCCHKSTELARWDIVDEPIQIHRGKHEYLFSHLLPGSIPATAKIGLTGSSIRYELIATAVGSSKRSTVNVRLPIRVSRSIIKGPDKNSLRIFPPTDMTADTTLPSVIYPKSTFNFEMRINNISKSDPGDPNPDADKKRWRLRKLSWKINEVIKVKAVSCEKHASKLSHLENVAYAQKTKDQKGKRKSALFNIGSNNQSAENTPEFTALSTAISSQSTQSIPSVRNNSRSSQSILPMASATSTSGTSISTPLSPAVEDSLTPAITPIDKSIYIEETRHIARGELKKGWKTDFTGDGKCEIMDAFDLINTSTGPTKHITHASSKQPLKEDAFSQAGTNVCCDLQDPELGIYVKHILIVELIVAEEELQSRLDLGLPATKSSVHTRNSADDRLAELSPAFAATARAPHTRDRTSTSETPSGSNSHSKEEYIGIPSGAARILRMQYNVNLTERGGLGIAWDDEVPPTYQDVQALSPPCYVESISNTPALTPLMTPLATPLATPSQSRLHNPLHHSTPGVLYGVGTTPGFTPFIGGNNTAGNSIDEQLNDEFQELRL